MTLSIIKIVSFLISIATVIILFYLLYKPFRYIKNDFKKSLKFLFYLLFYIFLLVFFDIYSNTYSDPFYDIETGKFNLVAGIIFCFNFFYSLFFTILNYIYFSKNFYTIKKD